MEAHRHSAPYPGDLLEHLRAFEALASIVERSPGAATNAYGRAAKDLAIDQSVLRRRLTMLDEHVGAPLFAGRGASLRLTTRGTRLREQAKQMLLLADSVLATTRTEDAEGPLRVACTGTILAEVLPDVLARLRRRYPKLRLRVRREGEASARRLVDQDEVDFAIVRGEHDPSLQTATRQLESRRLAEDRLWLVIPEALELAHRKRIRLDHIARAPLIGYPPTSATMKRIMKILAPFGATPWIEVDRKAAALAYVGAGLGIAFVSLVEDQRLEYKRVVVRDVTSLFPKMAFWLVWSTASTPSLTSWRRDFADEIAAAMRR